MDLAGLGGITPACGRRRFFPSWFKRFVVLTIMSANKDNEAGITLPPEFDQYLDPWEEECPGGYTLNTPTPVIDGESIWTTMWGQSWAKEEAKRADAQKEANLREARKRAADLARAEEQLREARKRAADLARAEEQRVKRIRDAASERRRPNIILPIKTD